MTREGRRVAPHPVIRCEPEDFRVEEVPLYPPSGEGTHTFVCVEKRLRTSEDVARDLARAVGVAAREVGMAGRKDRRAVSRQWFSVPGLDPDAALALELSGARVLEAARHGHKLRTGHLRANRFAIVVRGVDSERAAEAAASAARLSHVGMPNRFGTQRFGREGRNAERGLAWLRGEARGGDRRQVRFLVSALQADVFNRVLAERPVPLDALEQGDVARVEASGGLFEVCDLAREAPRAACFEISATGPIFGTKMMRPSGAVAEREAKVMEAAGVPAHGALRPPRGIRLAGGRRALRVRPRDLVLTFDPDSEVAHLAVELPSGSYATVLLEELFGPCDVAGGEREHNRAGRRAGPWDDSGEDLQ